MHERELDSNPEISPSNLFRSLAIIAKSGVLVETRDSSRFEYKGNYSDGKQIRPISISYSRVIGSEIIDVSTGDFKGKILKVDQPNTSPFDEHVMKGIPTTLLEALATIQPDAEAMSKLSASRAE